MTTTANRSRVLTALLFGLVTVTSILHAQSGRIDVIVVNGDPAPDGDGTVFDVGEPILNNAGQTAFDAKLRRDDGSFSDVRVRYDGTSGTILFSGVRNSAPTLNEAGQSLGELAIDESGHTGIFLSDGPNETELIRYGDPVSGGSRVFGVAREMLLNDAGQVVLSALVSLPEGGDSIHGIYLLDSDGVATIAESGEVGPNGVTDLVSLHDRHPQLNNSGQVAVSLDYVGQVPGGLFLWENGVFTEIAIYGQPTPLINSNGTGTEYREVQPLKAKINDHAAVAFSVKPEFHNTARWAIFQSDLTTTTPLYLSDSFSPFGPSRSAPPAYLPAFNDSGQVVFGDTRLVDDVETSMIIRADSHGFVEIVRNGDPMPNGEGTLFLTPAMALNNKGQIAFMVSTGFRQNGLLFYDDDHGLVEIIRPGAALLDGIVETIEVEQSAPGMLNDCGQVTFRFYLEDGRRGIAVADPLYYERQPLSGRVLGRYGSQFRGLSDAVVRATSDGQLIATAPCDSRGYYSFGPLPQGDYILSVRAPFFGALNHFVTLTKDADITQNFYLNRDSTIPRITGTLTDAVLGFGIGGASVTALIADTIVLETRTYGSGSMSLPLPNNLLPATATIRVSAPGYLDSETQVDVNASREFTHDISLVRDGSPTGGLRGRVLDSGTGLPIEDVRIYALNLDGGVSPSTHTTADGSFSLPGIAVATYRVWASATARLAASAVVIVNADEVSDLPLALELTPDPNGEAGALISEVTGDEDGVPQVRLSWPAHWINPVLECSMDMLNWVPIENTDGNSHTASAVGEIEFFRVRYEP